MAAPLREFSPPLSCHAAHRLGVDARWSYRHATQQPLASPDPKRQGNIVKPTHSLPPRFKRVGGVALGIAAVVALLAMAGCSYSRLQVAKELVASSDPFQAQPAAPVASLLVIGDSTAVGTGASSPAHSVAGMIGASHPHLRTVNRAVNGALVSRITPGKST